MSYVPNNEEGYKRLINKLKELLKATTKCGVHGHECHEGLFARSLFAGQRIPLAGVAHQDGTIRFGDDLKTSALDRNCRAHEVQNLYVVDASFELLSVKRRGERLRLAFTGNHCQGTMFRDGAHLITSALALKIDQIAGTFKGFYFGRFDVRYSNVDRFKAGEDLTIIKLNGVTSESTNLYDPTWSLLRAYRTLLQQWSILFQIGSANRSLGHRASTIRSLTSEILKFYRGRGHDVDGALISAEFHEGLTRESLAAAKANSLGIQVYMG